MQSANSVIEDLVPLDSDPIVRFGEWLAEAHASEINDANAMSLATVDAAGLPDVRIVLLKGHDADGFVFYTNTESAKGTELRANPLAAAAFHWKSLARQVRVRGPVETVTDAEADAYFASRPRDSRIGAWASAQSRPLADRADLERAVAEHDARYGDDVPRPPHWTGFRIRPVYLEFWRARPFRLHDRVVHTRPTPDAEWTNGRRYP
ncbi:pyridoxamine 5'-phosphate oxidase [Actinokineospora sp. HUAS TT18]|uniref:pyridoxamine 5'-phosphate oxidase n=1 Tax=Actinokineospora sp. HUAS TT18 TaxID=3447451 RepID=UPI003F51F090